MTKTVRTLQIIYFAVAILSFLVVIYLNFRKLQELEKEVRTQETQENNGK